MPEWTEHELQKYRQKVCTAGISITCEDCPKTKEDIIECYYDLKSDIGV